MIVAVVLPAAGTINEKVTRENKVFENQTNMEFAPGEFIVKLKKDSTFSRSPLATLNEKYQVYALETVFKNSENTILNNIYILSVPENADILSIIDDYSSCPTVEYAEPNRIFYVSGIPNDENFSKQWALQNTGQNGGTPDVDIDAPEAWDIEIGSSDVIIAVIDTGVDYTHPDLAGNIWINKDEVPSNGIDDDNNGFIDDVRGWDFANNDSDPLDDNGHGTHCSGIASAVTNNNVGVAGVCWNCKIMSIKGLDKKGLGWVYDLANAIIYATDNGADVISMSFGNYNSTNITHDAVDYAHSKGVVLVAAAGNIILNMSRKHYPAAFDNVIAVASTDKNDHRASTSNFGDWVDVAAPGREIYSTMPTYSVEMNSDPFFLSKNYDYCDGTSMACPMVAGLAALLLSYNPNLTPDEVSNIIHDSTDWINTDKYIGNGRINAYKALLLASGVTIPPNKPITPSGQIKGSLDVEYTYTSNATDLNGDQVYYLWNWGDSTNSGWLGPYNSGVTCEAKHIWNVKGNYNIKVKAKDIYNIESSWSDPLPITMPYSYNPILQSLELLFERFPNAFPLLRQLFRY